MRNLLPLIRSVTPKNLVVSISILMLVTLLLSLFSLGFGQNSLSPRDVAEILLPVSPVESGNTLDVRRIIFFQIRLPRLILAIIVGGSLSVAGVILQLLLRNVLAEPYILGISGGASVGALIAIATGMAYVFTGAISLFSFVGAAVVMSILFVLSRKSGKYDSRGLLLSGVMIGAFLSAIILILVSFIGEPIRHALFWILGSLNAQRSLDLVIIIPVSLFSVAVVMRSAKNYNALALGDEIAFHLGVRIRELRLLSYLTISLLTGVVVSITGSIGFIGLLMPHVARKVFGTDHRILIPAAYLIGGCFLLVSDFISKNLLYPTEIPVGVITAIIGAPVFLALMRFTPDSE